MARLRRRLQSWLFRPSLRTLIVQLIIKVENMATKEELEAVADRISTDITNAVAEITALVQAQNGSVSQADLQPILDKLTTAASALEAAPKPA